MSKLAFQWEHLALLNYSYPNPGWPSLSLSPLQGETVWSRLTTGEEDDVSSLMLTFFNWALEDLWGHKVVLGWVWRIRITLNFWYGSGSRIWKNSLRIRVQTKLWYGSGSRQKRYRSGSMQNKIQYVTRKILKIWFKKRSNPMFCVCTGILLNYR